jgi:hypothetical protein
VSSEFIRFEKKEIDKQLTHNHTDGGGLQTGNLESEALTLEGVAAVEASIKSMMKTYVQCSAAIVLDSWNEINRYAFS